MSKSGLTRQQRALLNFIEEYQARHAASPSYEEMMEALGLQSKSGVHRLVHALRDRGHITLSEHKARTIALVGRPEPVQEIEALDVVIKRCQITPDTRRELQALSAYYHAVRSGYIEAKA